MRLQNAVTVSNECVKPHSTDSNGYYLIIPVPMPRYVFEQRKYICLKDVVVGINPTRSSQGFDKRH